MATEKDTDQPKAAARKDMVSEIGTLTYERAVQNFGKDNAIRVMQQVATIGGHGLFNEDELTSPLFGGLAMPVKEADLAKVNELYNANKS